MTDKAAPHEQKPPNRGARALTRLLYLIVGGTLILAAALTQLRNMGPGYGRVAPAPEGGEPTRIRAVGGRWNRDMVTWTDAQGRYIFETVQYARPYRVEIERPGCEPYEAAAITFTAADETTTWLPACP